MRTYRYIDNLRRCFELAITEESVTRVVCQIIPSIIIVKTVVMFWFSRQRLEIQEYMIHTYLYTYIRVSFFST